MLEDLLERQFGTNTLSEWLLSIGIILGSIVLAKIVYWFIGKIVKRLTAKTKTKLDDIIVDMIEEPIVFAIIIAGIWYGLGLLDFSSKTMNWLHKIYYILVIFNVTWLVTRLLDALVEEYIVPLVENTESTLDDQLLPIIRKGFRVVIWIIAIILAINNAGYDVGALIAGLGIGGLAFALAAQHTVANLFGGFSIFMDQPFVVGDRIRTKDYDGFVTRIGVRSTRIRTFDNRIIVVPNSQVANAVIENVSTEPTRRNKLTLRLSYQTKAEKVDLAIRIVENICRNNQQVAGNFMVFVDDFSLYSIDLMVIFYIKILPDRDIFLIKGDVNFEIIKQFEMNNIQFARVGMKADEQPGNFLE